MNKSILALLILTISLVSAQKECKRTWKKVGCFKDNGSNRVFPNELANNRDPGNPRYVGWTLNWGKFAQSLHGLACECYEKAAAKGHKYFALQFWGECWSGPTSQFFREGKSEKCVSNRFGNCQQEKADQECVGLEFTNYVYRVEADEAKDVKPPVDGAWGQWSVWSTCDKKCGGGLRTAERKCNSPVPAHGGKECNGESEKTQACNVQACNPPVDGAWGQWSAWSTCDKKCGGGLRTAERKCNSPVPAYGGKDCQGDTKKAQACNVEACEQVCNKELEIGVMMDASSSVTKPNYDKMITFFQELTDEFIVNEGRVHFGGIHYSGRANLDFRISDKTYWQPAALKAKIATIPYPQGGTRTDKALKMAEDEFFCSQCGIRASAPKVLIIVTDGKSSGPKTMAEATAPLKNMGVHIIAIGVTENTDQAQLTQLASSANDVINISDFKYMADKLNLILKKSCPK